MVNDPSIGTSDVGYVVCHVLFCVSLLKVCFNIVGVVYTTRKSRNVALGSREKGV